MEYDRLKGAMSSGIVTESSKRYINLRLGTIKDLAQLSIHGKKNTRFTNQKKRINNNIYGLRIVILNIFYLL